MNDADRLAELESFSYPFLSGLASHWHREALRLHREGRLSLTKGIPHEDRQAWIACGGPHLPSPLQVARLEAFVKSRA